MMDERKQATQLDQALTALQQQGSAAQVSPSDADVSALLRQADFARQTLEPEHPSDAYVAATRARVLNRINSRLKKPKRRPAAPKARTGLFWLRRPALALASLVLALALLLSGTGVAYAASGSLPGDPLYGVKLSLEKARLAFTFSEQARVHFLNHLANQRLLELQTMQQAGRTDGVDLGLSQYADALDDLVDELQSTNGPGDLQDVSLNLMHHAEVLQGLLETAPAAAQPGLENAIEKSAHSQSVIEMLQAGGSPNDVAPGQMKKTESSDDDGGAIPPGQLKKTQTPEAGGNVPPGQAKKDQTPGPPPGRGGGPPPGRGNNK